MDFDLEQLQKLEQELLKKQQILSECTTRFQNNLCAFEKYNKEIFNEFKNYKCTKTIDLFSTDDDSINASLDGDSLYVGNTPLEVAQEQIDLLINNVKPLRLFDTTFEDYYGQIHCRYLLEMNKKILDYSNQDLNSNNALIRDFKSLPLIFILGTGLGYIISELYSKIEVENTIVIEPNKDFFFLSLFTTDYASLLEFLASQNQHIDFLIGTDVNTIMYQIENILIKYGRCVGATSANLVHYADDNIKAILDELSSKYKFINIAKGYFDDSIVGISHGIEAIKAKATFVKEEFNLGKYTKYPVFIVANGPSLDNDIEFLRKNQDKAFIVACGTALDTLYNIGVKPDFYAATERVSQVIDALAIFDNNNFLDDIILLGSNVLHKDVLKKFKNKALFIKADEDLSKIFPNNLKDIRKIHLMNPLVSNLGLSSMLNFGFREIYLFGVDNGVKDIEHNHSKHSILYSKLGGLFTDMRKILTESIEGNFGGYFQSSSVYLKSVEALNQIIDLYREISTHLEVINCSDGSKIPNAKAIHSFDLDFTKYKDIDKKEFFKYFQKHILTTIDFDLNKINSLINKSKFNDLCDNLIKAVSRTDLKTRFDYVQNLSNIASLFGDINNKNKINENILYGSVIAFLSNLQNALYSEKEDDKAISYYNYLLPSFIYFLQDAKEYFALMPHCIIDEMEEHFKKVGFDHEKSLAYDYPKQWRNINNKEALKDIKPFKKMY